MLLNLLKFFGKNILLMVYLSYVVSKSNINICCLILVAIGLIILLISLRKIFLKDSISNSMRDVIEAHFGWELLVLAIIVVVGFILKDSDRNFYCKYFLSIYCCLWYYPINDVMIEKKVDKIINELSLDNEDKKYKILIGTKLKLQLQNKNPEDVEMRLLEYNCRKYIKDKKKISNIITSTEKCSKLKSFFRIVLYFSVIIIMAGIGIKGNSIDVLGLLDKDASFFGLQLNYPIIYFLLLIIF